MSKPEEEGQTSAPNADIGVGKSSLSPGVVPNRSKSTRKSILRGLVSKKKRRYQENGYDLDLVYVTDKIIAMGFPSEGSESAWRNPMAEVQRFFEEYHKDHYKIYNLCSERSYDISKFNNMVGCYPFDDHNVPPISMLDDFCKDADKFLNEHPDNGRTGVMICAYLVWAKAWPSADEVMDYYGFVRASDQKGLTIPSQRRYVRWFEQWLKDGRTLNTPVKLMMIRLETVPKLGELEFEIMENNMRVYHSHKEEFKSNPCQRLQDKKGIQFMISTPLELAGDLKFIFNERTLSKNKDVLHFWINTAFVENGVIRLERQEIDNVIKDKHHKIFKKAFQIELMFLPEEDPTSAGTSSKADADAEVDEVEEKLADTSLDPKAPKEAEPHAPDPQPESKADEKEKDGANDDGDEQGATK